MKRTTRILGMGTLLVVGVHHAIGSTRPAKAAPLPQAQEMMATVKIDNFSFSPTTLQIKAGTKVTWTNADDIPHNGESF